MSATNPRSLAGDERGAMIVIGLFFAVMLSGFLYYVIGIGEAIVYRETMQDAADAGAFSAAVVHARGMNVLVLINMIMAALLAVLIALKLIETLIIGAIAVCTALAFVTFGATLAAIPPLNTARTTVRQIHDTARSAVFPMLELGTSTARVVRVAMPPAATVRAYDVVTGDAYAPMVRFGFTWPIGFGRELPTEDGDYQELCSRAAGAVGDVVALPFNRIHSRIGDWVRGATRGLITTFSRWFCSGEGGPPSYDYPVDYAIPATAGPSTAACEACDSNCEAICDRSEEEQQRSQPREDASPYECPTRGDGTEEPLCTQRAQQARVVCAPDRSPRRFDYVFQEAHMVRWFWREQIPGTDPPQYRDRHTGDELSGPDDQDELVRAVRRTSERNPCSATRGFPGAADWAPTWTTEDLADLCGRGTPQFHSNYVLPGSQLPIGRANAVREPYSIYRRLFACHERRNETLQMDSERESPGDTRNKVPQRMRPNVHLGEEEFQVRMVVVGNAPGAHMERGVELANWGRDVGQGRRASPLMLLQRLAPYSVAQAEFYYPTPRLDNREDWMWHMRWRARMRRFVMPIGDNGGSSCRDMPGSSGQACGQASGIVGMLRESFVH